MHLSTRSDKGDRQVLQAVFCGTCNKDCLVQGAMKAFKSYHTAHVIGRIVSWRRWVAAVIPSASLLWHTATPFDCWLQGSALLHCQSSDTPFHTHGELLCRKALMAHHHPLCGPVSRASLSYDAIQTQPYQNQAGRPFLACLLPQRMCSSVMAAFLVPRLLTHDPGCRLGSDRRAGDSSAAHQPEACHAQSQAL